MRTVLLVSFALLPGALAGCRATTPAAAVQEGTITLRIVGMTCGVNCPPRVQAALESVPGVEQAEVDYDTRTATVHCSVGCDRGALVAALQKQGFGAAAQ